MNHHFSFEVSLSSIPRFEEPNRFCTAQNLLFQAAFTQLNQRSSAGTDGISDKGSIQTEVGLSNLQFDEPFASGLPQQWF
jgi:hypothetical protein